MALTRLQKLVMAIVLLVILTGVFVLSLRGNSDAAEAIEFVVAEQSEKPATIVVHVAGQVNRPGLYRVYSGARVADAVSAAGGFSRSADTDAINLAAVLADGQQVLISEKISPAIPEVPVKQASPISSNASRSRGTGQVSPNSSPTQAMSQTYRQPVSVPRRISINSAGIEELRTLPGIGEELARRICYYRHAHGGFARIEDLTKVDGIGAVTLEKLRPYLTL